MLNWCLDHSIAVGTTLAFFPVYLWIRHPYRKLPLHVDTGYYVSNATIQAGRIRYGEGWNAFHAGCGKVIPELLYSWIWLRYGPERYASNSRLAFTLYNYVTAIAVGLLAHALLGGRIGAFEAGLVLYGLLSSESQFGTYYESGEQFELLPQVLSVLCVFYGISDGSSAWFGIACLIWLGEALFIKLSSVASFVLFFAWVAFTKLESIPPTLFAAGVVTVAFMIWLTCMGQGMMQAWKRLWGHERSLGRAGGFTGWRDRVVSKLDQCARQFLCQPIIPSLAILGALAAPRPHGVLFVYGIAVLAPFFGQRGDFRYFLLPLLPAVAIAAANGAMTLSEVIPWGPILLIVLLAIWWTAGHRQTRQCSVRTLHSRMFAGTPAADLACRSYELDSSAPLLRETLRGRSLLVYGPFTQVYALTGSTYPTPIVAATEWLDSIAPDWQRTLNRRLLDNPPEFVLDTAYCFNAESARSGLGLHYERCAEFPAGFELYRFVQGVSAGRSTDGATTFAPRSWPSYSALRSPVKCLLDHLAESRCRRLAIYGAGKQLLQHAEMIRAGPLEVAALFDDDPSKHGQSIAGWQVRPLDDAPRMDMDAILICAQGNTRRMRSQCRSLARRGVRIVNLNDVLDGDPMIEAAFERDSRIPSMTGPAVLQRPVQLHGGSLPRG